MKPSGQQFVLRNRDAVVEVTEVGGGLRTYREGEVEVLEGYGPDEMCSGGRGQHLLPWPNRVADGQYSWDGVDYQLPLSEPGRHNASHGLTRWANWTATAQTATALTMSFVLHAQPGWPFPLRCSVAYELADGLTITTTVANVGTQDAPVAMGSHPYLSPGDALVDDCVLTLPATTAIPTDDRGIPLPDRRAHDAELFKTRRIGPAVLDLAYADLTGSSVTLLRPDGHELELWWGEGYDFVQLFTGDTLSPERRRRGLAVEPMTAPANALQTGRGVIRLAPREQVARTWGVRVLR